MSWFIHSHENKNYTLIKMCHENMFTESCHENMFTEPCHDGAKNKLQIW